MRSPTSSPVHVLHAHTTMSVLDGASRVEEYVKYAVERGLGACACTDHGWLGGVYDLINASNKAGLKPIPGCEFYLKPQDDHVFAAKPYDYFHLTVWAKNEVGYRNLRSLASHSWDFGKPVVKWGKAKSRVTWEDLEQYSEGLIVGSGCIEGPIGKCILNRETEQAVRNADRLLSIFKDHLFFEVMPGVVDRDYVRGESVKVTGLDGINYTFMPDDILETEMGPMTAREALQNRPTEIFNWNPIRTQDGVLDVGRISDPAPLEFSVDGLITPTRVSDESQPW